MSARLEPGSVIGILGGGQLGRMSAMAARRLGYGVHVFAPEEQLVAEGVADRVVRAAYDDAEALSTFGRGVDACTFEFENVPDHAVRALETETLVRPSGSILALSQDRRVEKGRIDALGFPVTAWAALEKPEDFDALAETIGWPAILKTARLGYDGKGQRRVSDVAAAREAHADFGGVPCVLERIVPFVAELSVIVARTPDGAVAHYGPMLNEHVDHILDLTLVPAPVTEEVAREAVRIGTGLADALGLEGLLCVELFLTEAGDLLVNEIAPRPHNSGHWTLDGAITSQFEQHVRAVANLPLGATTSTPVAAMINLLGDLWGESRPHFERALADPDVRLHLYGKSQARPGRKMGHLNLVGGDREDVVRRLRAARAAMDAREAGPRAGS